MLGALILGSLSCRHSSLPGWAPLPPGEAARTGPYQDICPRWSHDGKWIAFLRSTPNRMLQLCVASADLKTVRKLLPPEVASPDRPFRSGRATYVTPETITWSPDDRFIA